MKIIQLLKKLMKTKKNLVIIDMIMLIVSHKRENTIIKLIMIINKRRLIFFQIYYKYLDIFNYYYCIN
jgi:hypothetical protein